MVPSALGGRRCFPADRLATWLSALRLCAVGEGRAVLPSSSADDEVAGSGRAAPARKKPWGGRCVGEDHRWWFLYAISILHLMRLLVREAREFIRELLGR